MPDKIQIIIADVSRSLWYLLEWTDCCGKLCWIISVVMMCKYHSLTDIARSQDERHAAFFRQPAHAHAWYASCPMPGDREAAFGQWHDAGFWNYPFAEEPFDTLFFFERLAGARVQTQNDRERSTFNTWCEPMADIDRIPTEVTGLPLWQAYEEAVPAARGALPMMRPAFTPLDWACNLCGTERLFLLLYDDEDAVGALLERLTALYLSGCRRLQALAVDCRTPFGFPGVYANDLQMPYLSPEHVERLLLPQYEKVAGAFGPIILSLNCAYVDVMRRVLAMEGVLGCLFDKRLPLPVIADHLGEKAFVINHYIVHPEFDRPTLHQGIYCNPIVQTYSEEIGEVWRVVGPGHRMVITVERPGFEEVCAVREGLERDR